MLVLDDQVFDILFLVRQSHQVLSKPQTGNVGQALLLAHSELQRLFQGKLRQLLDVLIQSGADHKSLTLRIAAMTQNLQEFVLESHL